MKFGATPTTDAKGAFLAHSVALPKGRLRKGVLLEEDHQIATRAREIYMQAGRSHAMPPGNITYMEPLERALIVAWYEGAIAE